MPFLQFPDTENLVFEIRTALDPSTITPTARRLIESVRLGNTNSFLYDVMGNVIQTTYPDGTLTRNLYDAPHNRASTVPFKYSSPFIGGADWASAIQSFSPGLATLRSATLSRFGLWQRAVKYRRASPRQKPNVGGSGSCKNSEASNSSPHAPAAANASVSRAAVAGLSCSSSWSSGSTDKCPPGDNANACDTPANIPRLREGPSEKHPDQTLPGRF